MQVHDFSPSNGENIDDPDPIFHLPGLFWLVRVNDEDLQFGGDEQRTAVFKVRNQLLFDRFQFMGPGNVPMHITFDTTYQQQPGPPHIVVPSTNDPLSPFNWAGTIFTAAAHGTFSAVYDDGTFSVTGTMDSTLAPFEGTTLGHMGHERNGVFALGGQQGASPSRMAPHASRAVASSTRRKKSQLLLGGVVLGFGFVGGLIPREDGDPPTDPVLCRNSIDGATRPRGNRSFMKRPVNLPSSLHEHSAFSRASSRRLSRATNQSPGTISGMTCRPCLR